MDSGTLALIISLATLLGGAIGWLGRQYWYYRKVIRELERSAEKILIDKKALLEGMISKTQHAKRKKELKAKLEEVNVALLGLYNARLRRILKGARLPTEDILVAEGNSQLQPRQIAQLNIEIAAIENLPQSGSIWDLLALASAHYYAGEYEEAKEIYDKILELNPESPSALHSRGITYSQLGNNDKAMTDLNRSLKLNKEDPAAFHNRALVYASLGKYKKALADYNKSLKLRPDDPGTLYDLACLFSLWGKTKEALDYLKKAIDKDKKWREKAKTDKDFDNIREDPRFKKLVGED